MNGWLIYSKQDAIKNKSYITWFIDEAQKQSLNLKLILREKLTVGIFKNELTILHLDQPVTLPTFAVVRTIDPLLSEHLEMSGVKVFNSSEVSRLANHKMVTHYEMNKLHVPMVDTLFIKRYNLTSRLPMKLPFVIKEATGRGGEQVHFIQTAKDYEVCQKQLTTSDLVIQSTNVQIGKDLRVYILGKHIIGAILRESQTEFRANFSLGGTATLYTLNDEEKHLINRIIKSFDFDLVGIDFLFDLEGNLLFNEIEDVVGSRMLSHLTDINLLNKYVTHIYKSCQ